MLRGCFHEDKKLLSILELHTSTFEMIYSEICDHGPRMHTAGEASSGYTGLAAALRATSQSTYK